MAALTGDKQVNYQPGDVYRVGLDGGSTRNVHKGALIVSDTDGYAIPGANTAAYRFLGVTTERFEQTATSTDGTDKIRLARRGLVELAFSSVAVADVGRPVWLTDDQTGSLTQTNVGPIGSVVERLSSTNAVVAFDANFGGAQHLKVAYGTSAFASGSTTVELATGLSAIVASLITNQLGAAPTKVMGADVTVTAGNVTVGRETSGTAEINFNYLLIGY